MTGGHAATFPRIKKTVHVSGSRGENIVEVSKNPQGYVEEVENQTDHPIEGDPDFRYDASRVYITADSKPDTDFGLVEQLKELPGGLTVEDSEGASIVVKSDHVRIIARKDPDAAADPKVNGSIRIVKEGKPRPPTDSSAKPPEGERAVITIEPDGTIVLDGPRVVIGNGHLSSAQVGSNMAGNYTKNDNVYIGGQDAQYSVFLAEELADTLMAFAVDVVNMLGATGGSARGFGAAGNQPSGATASIGNSGSPIVNPSAAAALATLQSNLEKSMSKVMKIK